MLANIEASLERRPRRGHLIHVRPVMHEAVLAGGRFEPILRYRNGRDRT